MKPSPHFSLALSVPLSRDKQDTLLLLFACTLVLAPQAAYLPLWTTLSGAALLLWRGWITLRGNRMPPRWLLLPIAGLAMGLVYASFKTFFGREAGVAMLVLLLAFKLLEMRAKRDLFVVVFLSFFLMLTNFFNSQSIATASLMVAAMIVLLTAQLSFQYAGSAPPLLQRLRLALRIFALALPLTLVLFVLFPRIQGPLWGLPGDAHGGKTGLSDSMAPGNISQLAQSDEIAFRVKFIDPMPPQAHLYWRGVVLGKYDGRTWTQQPLRYGPMTPIILRPRAAAVRHQVTLEPHGRRWLFALEIPQAAPVIEGNPSGIAPDMQLLAAQPINERIRYDAASFVDFDMQPNQSALALQDWLELPPGYNPRTLAFAQQLQQQTSDPQQLVSRVLQYFHEEKFRYTLEPPLLGKQAVDEFLFDSRAGFCEHYASAFVVLMRALDIPARVVTGYQGGEINPVDGYLTVRQSDAHAWAEVWLPKSGWTRVDPTAAVAPNRIETNLGSVLPRSQRGTLAGLDFGQQRWLPQFGIYWQAMNNSWNQWVLNYTPDRQKSFIESLGFNDVDWRTLSGLMLALGALVVALMTLPLLLHQPKIAAVDALYFALCQQMARRGCARAMHEGPRAFGARLQAALPAEQYAAVARFLALYETIKYGPAGNAQPPAVLISRLKSILKQCR